MSNRADEEEYFRLLYQLCNVEVVHDNKLWGHAKRRTGPTVLPSVRS